MQIDILWHRVELAWLSALCQERTLQNGGYFNQNVTSQPADALSPFIISNFIIFAYFLDIEARLSS